MFLCPSGCRWRIENLSRIYSRLRNMAGLPKHLVLYLARRTRLPEAADSVVLLSTFSRLLSRAALHLDDAELAEAQDLID